MHPSRMHAACFSSSRGGGSAQPPWMQPPEEADPPIGRPPSIPVKRQSGVKTLPYPKLRLRAVEILRHLLKMELLMIIEINDSFCDWRFEMWLSSTLLG